MTRKKAATAPHKPKRPHQAHRKGKPKAKKGKPHKLYFFSVIFAVVLAGVVFWLSQKKSNDHSEQAQNLNAQQSMGPTVSVVEVKPAPTTKELILIGETRPFAETTVYAKLSGYLKSVFVDKGDSVKADQPLAIIESPETNMGYLAAKADAYNKKRIAGRMRFLARRKLISAQEAEQAIAAADIAQAQLQTQSVLKGYETLRAPFAGTVVARYVDPGMLIQNASNSQAASLAVVTVSQIDVLRIYVYVDQRDAGSIQMGLPAEISLPDKPEMKLYGRVTRVPQQLDPRTRTLLAEIDFDNSRHQLVADSYVQVKIRLNTPPTLEVPSSALIYSGSKAYLPVVEQGHLQFKEAQVIEDDGVTARFVSRVAAGASVAMNVGQTLQSGDPVRAQQPQTMQANGGQPKDSKGSSASGTDDKSDQKDKGSDRDNGSERAGRSSGAGASSATNGLVTRQIAEPPPTQDTTGDQSEPKDQKKKSDSK